MGAAEREQASTVVNM